MSPAPRSPLLERALFALLACAAIYVPLVPVSHAADRLPLPDLLYCLTLAWVVRRPSTAPLALVLAAGLAADVLLARPPGLGALGLVLASEAVRGRRLWLSNVFAAAWLVAALLFALVLAATTALLALSLAPLPAPGPIVGHWLATVLAYPLMALAIAAAGRLGSREAA
jgi:rod shape-determining protein MreD